MSSSAHREAAAALRDAVAVLSARLATEVGDLVPQASAERTAALIAAVEAGAGGGLDVLTADDVRTLDSWIRLADSAVLHDDAAEARVRLDVAQRLRAVRELVASDAGPLTEDPRHD